MGPPTVAVAAVGVSPAAAKGKEFKPIKADGFHSSASDKALQASLHQHLQYEVLDVWYRIALNGCASCRDLRSVVLSRASRYGHTKVEYNLAPPPTAAQLGGPAIAGSSTGSSSTAPLPAPHQ
eukprot:1962-Heterococcus_DN1.PRE.1